MIEIELKLLLDPKQERMLRSGAAVKRAAKGRSRTRDLYSVYYDTIDGSLRHAGIALRLRRDGRMWIQTVKKASDGIAQGLSMPHEDECLLAGPEVDLSRIADQALREEVIGLARGGLAPSVETAFRRTMRMLEAPGGGKVELAIDVGEVRADGSAAPLTEAELEIKEGPREALFALARDLVTRGPVRFSNRSKAARADALRGGGRAVEPPRPVKARHVALTRETSIEDAAVAVLNEIQHQVAANIVATVETDAAEGPHQLRIGLRRLRSAFNAFEPAIGCEEVGRLHELARRLGRQVGALRDLDALVEDILPREAARELVKPGFGRLIDAVEARRAAVRTELRATLTGAETTAFVLDLAGLAATRGWRLAADPDALADRVRKLAKPVLDRRWKAVQKRARRIETLSTEERHEMRKAIKNLRYVGDMFGSLFAEKDVEKFRGALKSLRDDLGTLNDSAMVEAMLAGPDAPGAGDAEAQRAAGRVIGAMRGEAAQLWPRAVSGWKALGGVGPFWR